MARLDVSIPYRYGICSWKHLCSAEYHDSVSIPYRYGICSEHIKDVENKYSKITYQFLIGMVFVPKDWYGFTKKLMYQFLIGMVFVRNCHRAICCIRIKMYQFLIGMVFVHNY